MFARLVFTWKIAVSGSSDHVTAAQKPRFTLLSEEEIYKLVLEKDSQNTKDVLNFTVNILKLYSVRQLTKTLIIFHVWKFYAGVRKTDETHYASKSLIAICCWLQRQFQRVSAIYIISKEQFKPANDVFFTMLTKQLKKGSSAAQGSYQQRRKTWTKSCHH